MSNQPADDHNAVLRYLIREAVEREWTNSIAPVRSEQQIQAGMLKQFNRDVIVLQQMFGDLDELVRGNPKQNLVGLAQQIQDQNKLIGAINNRLDEAKSHREALINQVRGARYALIVVGFVTGLPYLEWIG